MNGPQIYSICVAALTGTAWLHAEIADRRRKALQQRLAAVTEAPGGDQPEPPPVSVRRETMRVGARRLGLFPQAILVRLESALAATGNRIGAEHLIFTGVGTAALIAFLAGGVLQMPPVYIVPLATATGILASIGLLREAQSRYRRRFLDVFPDSLDLLVRAVRAGLPVLDAMQLAAREIPPPVSTELKRTLDEMRIGVDLHDAFQKTAERIRIPDFQFFVVSLVLQRRTGGGLAEMLSNLSTLIRRRREVMIKARALTAEAKASAFILSLLPPIVGVGLFIINRDLVNVILFDPRGRFMLGLAITFLVGGISLMFSMVRKSTR